MGEKLEMAFVIQSMNQGAQVDDQQVNELLAAYKKAEGQDIDDGDDNADIGEETAE